MRIVYSRCGGLDVHQATVVACVLTVNDAGKKTKSERIFGTYFQQLHRLRHGPWRLANSPAPTIALPNAYFDSLGVPRLTVR